MNRVPLVDLGPLLVRFAGSSAVRLSAGARTRASPPERVAELGLNVLFD
jgi:hypothetical protein